MKKVGNYTLLSKIGEGAFGQVFKAQHATNEKIYAVKLIPKSKINNPKMKELFAAEIHIMSTIKHPNLLHLHEYLESSSNHYLVLDFCDSGDMEHHVKKH